MERRKGSPNARWSPLPVDYLKLVCEVFATNFGDGLDALKKLHPGKAWFEATGRIYPEEIVLAITLLMEKKLAANTVYASMDFDPKASSPTIQDLLATCVDAVGGIFATVLDPKNPNQIVQLVSESTASLEDVPLEWTKVDVEKFKVYLKMDKANPGLEMAADEWLAKNDPDLKRLEEETEAEVEKLFVTGPKKGQNGGGSIH